MSGIRPAATALAVTAGLALCAVPAAAQQALATVSTQGLRPQAFCLSSAGRLADCTPESNVLTRTYVESRNAFVFRSQAGTCLDGALGEKYQVRFVRCSGKLAQDWFHVDNRRVQNKASNLCLDVSGNRKAAGTPVILWKCSGADNQVFAMVQVVKPEEVAALGQEVPGGIRTIAPQDLRTLRSEGAFAIAAGGYNLVGSRSGNLIGQAGSNAIAAGGGNAIAAGGGNAIAAGGGNAIAAGGGNLVGQAGTNAIAAGGGNAIAAGGGNAIAAGGGNAIAAGGGNAIAAGGGNYRVMSDAGGDGLPQLAAGPDFTCGVAAGTAHCWGYNGNHELGLDPHVPQSLTPAPVAGGLSFRQISAEDNYACGVAADGRLYCWGRMATFASKTPRVVGEGLTFRTVDAGDRFFCAVATDGRVLCQGKNASGELGTGTKTDSYYALVPLSGGLTFTSVSAGARHACGLTADGAAYCWGYNLMSQLGTATNPTTGSLVPVAVDGGLRFRSVSAGRDYTCGVTTQGEAYCWGANEVGQTGQATGNAIRQPTRAGTFTATSISTGNYHTCAVTTDEQVQCWGRNGSWELGDGTNTSRRTPAPVTGGLRFASVTVNGMRTCATTTAGEAYCWGANESGANGDGSTTTLRHQVPTKVVGWPR